MDIEGEFRLFTGRLAISVNDGFHEVKRYHEGRELEEGFGYIKGKYVYVFQGVTDQQKDEIKVPGIYQRKSGKVFFIKPKSEKDKGEYSIDNIIELDIDRIFENIQENQDSFITEDEIEIINNNGEVFRPTLNEDDDFLKRSIKESIINKKISLKNYKNKFSQQYGLNNRKSSLTGKTKMSVPMFTIWCHILGLKWTMIVDDDGTDQHNRLEEPLVFHSDDFQ